jgi:hypothetical protein
MIQGLARQSQSRISTADAHHPPEATDATPPATIVDIARAPGTEKTQSGKGAGLEIVVIMGGTEMVVEPRTGKGAPAENVALTGEVSNTPRQFLLE